MVADDIYGPYTKWAVMDGTDEDFSHVTQTGFFYTVKGSKQETVLFCGDRWSDFAGNGIGYNQWVPLTVNGNNVKFNSYSEWNLNAQTGEWSVGAGNNWCLNPSFEADRVSQTTLAGCKTSGTGNSNKKGGHTGNWCAYQYNANAYKATLTQDTKLPNGNYTMKAWVKSTGGQKTAMLYARTANGDKILNVNKKMNDWTQVTTNDIQVTNGTVQLGIYSNANAGNWLMVDDITLIGNGENIQPVVPEQPKIADGKYIKSLTVNDGDNAVDWSIQSGLGSGKEVFGDRQCKFTAVPEQLRDAEWIRTACDLKKYAGEDAVTTTVTNTTETTTSTAAMSETTTSATTITAVETKTASTTEITTTTAAVNVPLYGDANCDGKVTVSDAVAILQYIGNKDKFKLSPEGLNNADVFNREDGITANDALSIQKLDAGIIDTLPES